MIEAKIEKKIGPLRISAGFRVEDREILALFGPSGAGKTSIVNMVAGLLRPDRGFVSAGQARLFDSELGLNLPPARRRIGYIFQDDRLFPHLSVQGNLNYGLKLTPAGERWVNYDEVLETLGIGHLLKRFPHRLSGGEKQRVALGRALLTSPRLLLMDEPLTSVDEERKSEILALIKTIPAQFRVPVLYVSHAREELESLAARIVPVHNGRTG
ncbi:MAG: ATP-binding cassette domain-containing protein [Thermodesulfobacteriota bacterium]